MARWPTAWPGSRRRRPPGRRSSSWPVRCCCRRRRPARRGSPRRSRSRRGPSSSTTCWPAPAPACGTWRRRSPAWRWRRGAEVGSSPRGRLLACRSVQACADPQPGCRPGRAVPIAPRDRTRRSDSPSHRCHVPFVPLPACRRVRRWKDGRMSATIPQSAAQAAAPYDALLLYSFGGPNRPEDVVPFLRNVTAGKGIPDERLEEVGEHYYGFGGKSPINEQNLALKAALEAELAARGIDLPVVWGNRNWEPYTNDAVDELEKIGAKRAVALVTSAFSSYSGCRQYREDLAVTLEKRGQL